MPHIFSYCFSPCSTPLVLKLVLSTRLKSMLVKLGIIFPRFGVKLLKKYLKPQSSFFVQATKRPPHPKKKLPWWYISCTNHIHSFFWCWKFAQESFRWYMVFLDVSLDLSCGLVAWSWISSIGCVHLCSKTFRKVKWLMMMAPSSSILGQIRQTKEIFALASLQKAFRKHLPWPTI